ncbi:hypothetical protein BCR41DRAFT_56129 [Lobosporangium transversale]|uniref:Uncharacterized protein n=1 Tax=Lobosporangium transversale TaxID=64571 RepID=A0A1Y2GNN1_9FUNG|nr:hypothetical protein BCR41DRAFT_56129 [Lobosporangium transversale]ORZ16782.1 hypothetical protein BCR41DRAFT_56129 [Lobosporangium transversale]|eukprot:XP_021881717.1 hypothetical protein BCR41DRAFT_56129 [Lobosporangium transversale]
MRASLEEKATGEFLSPKLDGEKDSFNVMEGHSSPITTRLEDPLGVVSIDQTEEKDLPRKKVSDAASFTLKQTGGEQAGDVVVLQANSSGTDALDEALKDLMQQLEAKTKQCEQLQNELGQRTAELSKQKSDHDEKMKKMKAIFAAANKNLNEYRQSIAAKDEEIAELKTKLENQQSSESQTVEQTQAIQELEAELKSQSEVAAIKLQQMESKNRQVNTQLEKLKTEYQQYKQRANLLLQQQRESVQTDDVGRLKELQEQLDNLTKDNR